MQFSCLYIFIQQNILSGMKAELFIVKKRILTFDLYFKSDWLITMLFQDQQRCWPRNMLHLVKSGSALSNMLTQEHI